jgi:hypothetical protein
MDKKINPALSLVKEVLEVKDVVKVSQMLESGNWICIGLQVNLNSNHLFVLGRVL